MRIVAFLDLDDSLFQTRAKCADDEDLHPVAYRRDGEPLSYMTSRQRTLLDMWLRSATVIPATARNRDALSRVDIAWEHAAILDFGGVVLAPGGTLDPAWDAEIRPRALELKDELYAWQRFALRLEEEQHLGTYARVVVDFDMPLYLVVKHKGGDAARLEPVRQALEASEARERFFLHHNDNNLSLVPRFLGKEKAVRHVLQRYFASEPVLTIGMGDSLTDAPFLDLCDYSVMPRACQLARQRFSNPRKP
jgi:hypothetical protein